MCCWTTIGIFTRSCCIDVTDAERAANNHLLSVN